MSPSRIHCVFALLSDESLAEAHSTLGLILSLHDWDAESGEREFRRAIELNPKDPTTLLRYGLHLVSLGHFGRAEAALRRALEIDPFSLMTNTHLGGVLMHRRQYEAAKDQLLKTVGMEPNFPEAHFYLMAVYGHTGKMEEAFAHIQQGITLSGGDVRMRCALISLKAATGRKEEARNQLQELLDLAERTYISPFHMALAHLGFGDFDQVFDMLEKAFQERSPLLRFLKVIASFDVLRPDPRFQDLLHRVWLTPQNSAF